MYPITVTDTATGKNAPLILNFTTAPTLGEEKLKALLPYIQWLIQQAVAAGNKGLEASDLKICKLDTQAALSTSTPEQIALIQEICERHIVDNTRVMQNAIRPMHHPIFQFELLKTVGEEKTAPSGQMAVKFMQLGEDNTFEHAIEVLGEIFPLPATTAK